MNRLGFFWARWRGDEAALMRLSAPLDSVMAELDGAHVALVGNARALATTNQGATIEAADLVIRLNAAPLPSPASHGTRTDWLAMSIPVSPVIIAARTPQRLIWVTPRRRRLPWAVAQSAGFALIPASLQTELATLLGARPTTGAMMIALLVRSRARKIDLWGFDFFASLSLSGTRKARDVPHDFAAEAAWVARLLVQDKRLQHHAMSDAVTGLAPG